MVEGVVKYKNTSTPTVEGTIMCVKPFIDRVLVDLRTSVNILPYSLYTDLFLPPIKKIVLRSQLANLTVVLVKDIIEVVQFQRKDFIFLIDFTIHP